MNKGIFFLFAALIQYGLVSAQAPPEQYPVDSASVEHAGVPKGEILKFTFDHSKIFPGTWREYWIYIPAQYKPDQPACVYVNQDGIQWKAPVVFDNLINKKEMPVTIGVFVTPGRVRASDPAASLDRFDRSFEYDGLGDAYVRFILDEILPEVETKRSADGRPIHLSKNGNDRAIGGSSSGAIAAFTAAWERPDAFSRVFSAIGTYVSLRGGDRYPGLIRKYEPKPLRIFLQDGSNDNNHYGGDWWKANEMMERALTFAGYEVKHVWGEGGHSGAQGISLFPDAMRWLWKDWPAPVAAGQSKNQVLNDILIPGEGWELVGQGYNFTEGTATNATGDVFFQDIPNGKTYRVGADGKPILLAIDSKKASGTCFGPDGRRYTCTGSHEILSYSPAGDVALVADSIAGNDLVMAHNGNLYVTSPNGSEKPGKIILVTPKGEKRVVDEGIKFPNGAAFTPDQTQLYVTESASHWVWVYTIMPDGSLANKQRFGWLHVPDTQENAWPDGLKCDTAGRVYTTSRMGVQILDQIGRVNAILPVPSGQASNVCFGGSAFNILYVTCSDKVYRRKLKTRGANPFEAPYKPVTPRL
ncbi:SMP-30/gluconolactonase/LRE family protein [Flavitalea sp. BT771]|uniref:SMP-30/gluconolactonase/LRE family protein n=1 Tax=Flavitalea sp. BT771 TaxID=3063329 RepID=UPI0026E3DF16|nr:SMP-30/gluconolactonase/LRE family protein [Flavitalea sp. BT771]MDO6429272.1 SMP-30/gluconolactonase/LRE family protein [Flavitalea sp. BT771]MDV6218600.1 SMP-30/gluconolactonase/LRE family protein [Flavitalea sp. BT771]